MELADFVKKYRKKKKKKKTHEQQDEDDRKRREVSDVADDDTSRKRDKSVTLYETTSKAWHEGYAPPAAKVMPKKAMPKKVDAAEEGDADEGPPPKKAMPNPSPKKVDASSVAATGSVSKAAVASSAAAAIDNRHSTIGVAKAAGARSAAAAASSAAASSAAASSDGAAIGNRQSTVDNRQSTIDSSGGEAWRTTRQDITVWNEVLTANGVDKAACQDLFLLAQHSSDGYKEANHIMSKLIKKQQDKQLVTNTSAFVHKCVFNVRHKLMSQANDSWSEYSNAGWMDAPGWASIHHTQDTGGEYPYWQRR